MNALFPLDVRLSTWLALAAFAATPLIRPGLATLYACVAWLFGFEAAFQATALTLGHPLPVGLDGPIFFVVVGSGVVIWLSRRGVRPSAPIMALVVFVWVAWLAAGFPVNGHTTVGLNVPAEILNEAAKSLCALAYLWPVWHSAPRARLVRA